MRQLQAVRHRLPVRGYRVQRQPPAGYSRQRQYAEGAARAAGTRPRQRLSRLGARRARRSGEVRPVPACVRTCPTKALLLVDIRDIDQASRRKREMNIMTDYGDLSLLQSPGGEA